MEQHNEEIKKNAEFTMMSGVLMEHCMHLEISDDAVEKFKSVFMTHGYKGVYECLLTINEECGCEECIAIQNDFKP